MRNALSALLLLYLCSPLHGQTVTVGARHLLDVRSGQLTQNQVIEIDPRDGIIRSVRPRRQDEAITYDLGELTVLPGLIDCHVHLVGGEDKGALGELRTSAASATLQGVVNARKTLESGFTTVRDLGSRDFADVALRDAIDGGRIPGPRMLVAVKAISPTGGHGDRNDLPQDVEVHRYTTIADGPDEVRRKVRENIKYGADWIKILATGGVMSNGTDPGAADYSEEELRSAVVTARDRGRDVAAHAHGRQGILRAMLQGVRSVEHASMMDQELVSALKQRGVFVVMNPYTNFHILAEGRAGGYQEHQIAKSKEIFQQKMSSLRLAIRAGIRLAFGSDAGVQPHGLSARQFSLYVEAGMTPLQAIRSATLTASELLRMEQKIGHLKQGFLGDLVAVSGDPLKSVKALESPRFVMKGGVVVLDRRAK